jgi:hypothetical protein
MKLGTETGSVINHLYARSTIGQPVPAYGMGATELLWSDRHACTITNVQLVRGKTIITVQRDYAKVVSGSAHDGSAAYEYAPNPNGSESHYRLEANGNWQGVVISQQTGRWGKAGSRGLRIGERQEYYDPSF